MKILIADDEELEREYLKLLLEKNDHIVTAVDDGSWAAKAFRDDPTIDLVITDLRMVQKSGLDAIPLIKEVRGDARIWLVSSFLKEETIQEALSRGAEKAMWKTHLECELRDERIIKSLRTDERG